MKKILPSIISANFTKLEKEIIEIEKGGADLLHVDIMDGHFVPNITIGPDIVRQIRGITGLPLDVHLMIEEPEKYIQKFAAAGANNITVHVEIKTDVFNLIQQIKKTGQTAGITLKPITPVEEIEPYITEVDLILVMSVNPGFSGQTFMPEATSRIRKIKALCASKGCSPIIEVDGGIRLTNAKEVSRAGVNYFVLGSGIFGEHNRTQIIREIKAEIHEDS